MLLKLEGWIPKKATQNFQRAGPFDLGLAVLLQHTPTRLCIAALHMAQFLCRDLVSSEL